MTTMPRMSITLPEDAADHLKLMAEELGVTQSEVVRRSLEYHRFLVKEIRAGRSIFTEGAGGNDRREIVVLGI